MNQILKFENTKQQITIDKDTCDDIRVADIRKVLLSICLKHMQ